MRLPRVAFFPPCRRARLLCVTAFFLGVVCGHFAQLFFHCSFPRAAIFHFVFSSFSPIVHCLFTNLSHIIFVGFSIAFREVGPATGLVAVTFFCARRQQQPNGETICFWLPAGRWCHHFVSLLVVLLVRGALVHLALEMSWAAHCFLIWEGNRNEGSEGGRVSVGGSRRGRGVRCEGKD